MTRQRIRKEIIPLRLFIVAILSIVQIPCSVRHAAISSLMVVMVHIALQIRGDVLQIMTPQMMAFVHTNLGPSIILIPISSIFLFGWA